MHTYDTILKHDLYEMPVGNDLYWERITAGLITLLTLSTDQVRIKGTI